MLRQPECVPTGPDDPRRLTQIAWLKRGYVRPMGWMGDAVGRGGTVGIGGHSGIVCVGSEGAHGWCWAARPWNGTGESGRHGGHASKCHPGVVGGELVLGGGWAKLGVTSVGWNGGHEGPRGGEVGVSCPRDGRGMQWAPG